MVQPNSFNQSLSYPKGKSSLYLYLCQDISYAFDDNDQTLMMMTIYIHSQNYYWLINWWLCTRPPLPPPPPPTPLFSRFIFHSRHVLSCGSLSWLDFYPSDQWGIHHVNHTSSSSWTLLSSSWTWEIASYKLGTTESCRVRRQGTWSENLAHRNNGVRPSLMKGLFHLFFNLDPIFPSYWFIPAKIVLHHKWASGVFLGDWFNPTAQK